MQKLVALELEVREGVASPPNSQRTQVYLPTGDFVAWFQADERLSGEAQVTGANIQFIYRKELSPEQVAAIKEWLVEQLSAAL
ncbi:MAG: hypothetical protein WDZ93_03460 [Candidatus Paceibacterota bacterium]